VKAPRESGLRRTALITGASGGIGRELALLFAQDGYDLVLVARSRDKLDELAGKVQREHGISVRVSSKDLCQPGAPEELYAELAAQGADIHVLVNNAGFGVSGPFAEASVTDALEMMQLNMVALTHLTRLFVTDMLKRSEGRILNIGSTAAFAPGPMMAVYYATKAYVVSLSEALANELAGSGVTVTVLAPGPTDTGFADRAGNRESRLFRGSTMDPGAVAEIGYRALMRGKTLVVPGLRNRVMAFSVRLAPRRLVTQLARRMQEARL
jgi:short-subunit dehydrogenase